MISDLLGNQDIFRILTNFIFYIRNKKVLIIGAGGGGDAAGCLPLYFWIKQCGGIPILGSLTWERVEVFSDYGPRTFGQIRNIDTRYGTVGYGNEQTKIAQDGTLFQASRIARILKEPIVFLDITKGVVPLVRDLNQFCMDEHIYMVIALDVGGDIIAKGTEKGLRSPLADAMTFSAVAQISIPSVLGIFALNCDGELTLEELNEYLQHFNFKGWVYGQHLHTKEELEFMEQIIHDSEVITEASSQPLRYLKGERGYSTIRKGTRKVLLDPIITHSFLLQLDKVYTQSPIAQAVAQTTSIAQANQILLDQLGLISEYESEKRDLLKAEK